MSQERQQLTLETAIRFDGERLAEAIQLRLEEGFIMRSIEARALNRRLLEVKRETRDIERELKALEEQNFIGIIFTGNSAIYTYELQEGPPVGIGDFVAVYSPMTDQTEIVKVVRLGRGSWTLPTKVAHRIEWEQID